ncbi:hypothetical protein BDZ91DRAFT_712197 [Kalaharituber pfeilii]|nr:hypothetical protein BDZ91DRAFT_712197 [Kalaharituber pfeilii]
MSLANPSSDTTQISIRIKQIKMQPSTSIIKTSFPHIRHLVNPSFQKGLPHLQPGYLSSQPPKLGVMSPVLHNHFAIQNLLFSWFSLSTSVSNRLLSVAYLLTSVIFVLFSTCSHFRPRYRLFPPLN